MDATQIILIVLIVALIVIYPVMIYSRNKKQRQQMQEQTNSLKRGDRVLTASGVYGTIVDMHQDGDKTIVTIETGMGNNKGYIALDAFAIYSIIREDSSPEVLPDEQPAGEVTNESKPAESNQETNLEKTAVSEPEVEEQTQEIATQKKEKKN